MIRSARIDDVPMIRRLMQSEAGFWDTTWRVDVLERALNSAVDLAFVWEEGGQIRGFICAHDLGFRAYLNELIVAKSIRTRGVGTQLVQHIEHLLEKRGCSVLISDVWKDSVPFYKSLGWAEPGVVLLRKHLKTNLPISN